MVMVMNDDDTTPEDVVVLVAGATGYTGRQVVRQLCAQGVDTIAHIRPESASRERWEAQFEEWGARVDFTPWDGAAWVESLVQVKPSHLYFLIGTTKARMRDGDVDASYEAIDYGLFRLLLQSCEKAGVTPKVVYLSAMGVRQGARTAYYRARWKAEEALRHSGLSYVIARPGMITGPDRDESRPMERVGGWMADAAGAGLRLVGARRMAARVRSTDSLELAAALVELGLDERVDELVAEAEDLKRDGTQ